MKGRWAENTTLRSAAIHHICCLSVKDICCYKRLTVGPVRVSKVRVVSVEWSPLTTCRPVYTDFIHHNSRRTRCREKMKHSASFNGPFTLLADACGTAGLLANHAAYSGHVLLIYILCHSLLTVVSLVMLLFQ